MCFDQFYAGDSDLTWDHFFDNTHTVASQGLTVRTGRSRTSH